MAEAFPSKIIVDFTNTKERSGYNPKHQAPGDYAGIIKSVEYGKSQKNQTPMITYAIADEDMPSATYRYMCTLTEASLWKLRNILVAAGIPVKQAKVNIAAAAQKIVGRKIGMTLEDNEYDGKVNSQIVNVFPADDLPSDEDDDDDDEPPAKATKKAPAKKATKKAAPVEDEEDTEDGDDEEEDLDELDIDDL